MATKKKATKTATKTSSKVAAKASKTTPKRATAKTAARGGTAKAKPASAAAGSRKAAPSGRKMLPAGRKVAAKRTKAPKNLTADELSLKHTVKRVAPKKAAEEAAPQSRKVALAVAEAALDKKAVNVEIIDVVGKVDYADFVVVMSGRSDRQVQALARGIAEDVQAKTNTKCIGIEGVSQATWVLMDFGDVVVHIFHDDVRGYYDLESLWMDANRVPVPNARP